MRFAVPLLFLHDAHQFVVNMTRLMGFNAARSQVINLGLSLGGTLSGEHGIGTAKSKYMTKEVGQGSIQYAKRLKAALDPKGILNPGKITGE